MDAPFGAWRTQTFIAGLSAGAMIAPSPLSLGPMALQWQLIKGAMDGPAFAAYIEKVLVPELAPGTVVILDNLATHKNAAAAKALRDAGCWFVFGENRPLDAFLVLQTLATLQPRLEPD